MRENVLTIDGRRVTADPGQTILQVALAHGIDIPRLCHDPRLTPTGACRLCVVEIDGQRGLHTACTRLAEPGMAVKTETETVVRSRTSTLELLLSEHNVSCTTCDADGACLLQDYAYRYQAREGRFPTLATASQTTESYTAGHKGIVYDPSKCVRCQRCVKICAEVEMAEALTMKGRALDVQVSTAFDLPLNDTTCEICGLCVSTCPTGALAERAARGEGRAKDLNKVRTTCTYCGVGCQIDLNVSRSTGQIVKVTSETGVIPNNGNLCVKGSFGLDFVADPTRLRVPLIKRDGRFEEATWDEALQLVAARFAAVVRESGPDAVGGLASAKCTNEENYLFQKFMRAVVGTNNVDHCARLCHASTVAGLARAFGSGAMTNSIAELERAKCIFVIGSNTTEAHPVIGLSIKEAVRRNGAVLIVADPRRIDLVRFARCHLRQRPGSDVALINAMMQVIVEENLLDREFVDERTEEFDSFAASLAGLSPEWAEPLTGVAAADIRKAARAYAQADTASIVYSMGITQHSTGTDNVLALANLAMLTGNLGRESVGVNPLRGQNNVQGACDMGALPNVFPGYQSVRDPALTGKFEAAWERKLPQGDGLTVVEMLHAAEHGDVRALYIMGENPALSDPNLNRARRALDKVEFLVVQDIFLTETAQFADVVLPSLCFAEKDGTFTNTERRVQRVRRATAGPGQARGDIEIICALATAMGSPMHYPGGAAEVMAEIASLTPSYGGISYPRLDGTGLQWPCPTPDHPGTPFLHKDKMTRGKGKFHPVDFREPAELPDEEYPFILTTGRLLYQYHTGTMTRKAAAINQVSPTGYVEINPRDAEDLGLGEGDAVQVSSRRGVLVAPTRITTMVPPGCLFIAFHFSECAANLLTNDVLDPVAKIPELKVCSARARKA